MRFQENLRMLRERAGFESAKDFAENILNIKYTTYLGYENQGREPKYDLLCKIAEKLGISPNDLLGYKPNEYEQCKRTVECAGFSVSEHDDIVVISPKPGIVFNFMDLQEFHLKKECFIQAVFESCDNADQGTRKAYDTILATSLENKFIALSNIANRIQTTIKHPQ